MPSARRSARRCRSASANSTGGCPPTGQDYFFFNDTATTEIYTRTGDDGTTGLGDGSRIDKDALRIAAIGNVDELNSAIGRVLAHDCPVKVRACLEDVQHDLFELGAELCLPGVTKIEATHLARLERELDA